MSIFVAGATGVIGRQLVPRLVAAGHDVHGRTRPGRRWGAPARGPGGRRLRRVPGAKEPMRVPRFIGRLFAGEAGVVMTTNARGASNTKAKRDLAGRPAHASWRQGFAAA